METIIFWASLGLLLLAILIGFGIGLIRGLKRSAVHLVFLVGSIIVAFLLTKVITNAILEIRLPIDNGKYTLSEYVLKMLSKSFDISSFDSANQFILNLPSAIVSPFMFILLSFVFYWFFDIAYLITARLCFGKKKVDFKENKPHRAFGGLIGIFEGLIMLVLVFGPLSSLTGTYKELTQMSSYSVSASSDSGVKTISQYVDDAVPETVDKIVLAWDKSPVGKLPKIFGLNNALFDHLSSVKVKGNKIALRKELTNIAYAYDDIVEIYDLAANNKYDKIKFGELRASLNYVLDGNLFKVVISDSLKTFVLNYQDIKADLGLNTTALMDDIVAEMKQTFSKVGFDARQYLKEDINAVVDVFDVIFSNDLINKYDAISEKDLINILQFVKDESSAVGTISKKVLSLNLVSDSFNVLLDKASKEVEKQFAEKENEVKLNTNITNKNKIVDELLSVVDSIIDLNSDINLADILKTDDIVDTLTSVDNIYKVMVKIGNTFDKVREFELLVLPAKGEDVKPTYVFDNILKNYGIELLGDEVYLSPEATEKTKLDTYSKFFGFVGGPIDVAKEIGLTDFGKDGVSFDSIFDKLLLALKVQDEGLLTRVVTPFQQLQVMDLKTRVFDKVVSELNANVELLSLDEVIELDDYFVWVEELDTVGRILNLLNTGINADGTSEIEGYNNTYIKYLMQSDHDLEKAMKALLANDRLGDILENMFSARVFDGLTEKVFDVIDNAVRDLTNTTGLVFKTDRTSLAQTKENTVETIEGILELVLSDEEIAISDYGRILNLLKINASNGGQKNGVFNNIYVNVIWYLTGDDLTQDKIFSGYETHENAADIKAFLNVSDYYGEDVDFEKLMKNVETAINLAQSFDNNEIDFTITDADSISSIVSGIETSLDEMTEEEKVAAIENLDELLRNKNESLLSEDDKLAYADDINVAINETFGSETEVARALKNLLGI